MNSKNRYCFVRRSAGLGFVCLFLTFPFWLQAQSHSVNGCVDLTLSNYLARVLLRNETVQAKLLETEASRRKAKAEYGIFEPELFGSAQRQINERENTVEQERATLSSTFEEDNNVYQGGLESLVPSGARVRLGYTLRDLNNNLQESPIYVSRGATNGEYQTFVGVSLTQPLLKGAGPSATMAGIRIAALESDVAFQEYRRQLMLTIATAEASYWNLYLAQEQVRFFTESLATAEKILRDNRERLEAGKSSELEVLEAEAGAALRRSKLSEAEQKLYEANARLLSLCSETVLGTNRLMRATDQPQVGPAPMTLFDAWQAAYQTNPDYQIQRLRVMQEANRLGYTRNQRRPELNLIGSYGFNGLGETPGQSWEDIEHGGFPSWAAGVEMRVPVGGGIKGANELAAAKLRYRAAQLGLREIETQMANSVDTALQKIRSAGASVKSYQTVAEFNQSLLDSALARLDVGKLDSRKVLEIEADVFEARNAVAEALVQHQRAALELELVAGVVLKQRSLDTTKGELADRTAQLLRGGGLTDVGYEQFVQSLREGDERRQPGAAASPASSSALPVAPSAGLVMAPEGEAGGWSPVPKPATTEDAERTRDAMRRVMEELGP